MNETKLTFNRKSKILSDTNQYPDNKLLTEQEQQQQTSESGEKSDESSEKYVIDKPEDEEKSEYDDEDGKRDDSEKVIRADKKIVGEKLPPGWEKHEGGLKCFHDTDHKILMAKAFFSVFRFFSS
jgi:hypothetical protein